MEAERPKMKYFTEADFKETLTGEKVDSKKIPEARSTYKYKSGSFYTGEWVGGFR